MKNVQRFIKQLVNFAILNINMRDGYANTGRRRQMINYITTGVIFLVIVGFSFFIGTLVGSDNQAAKDRKVFDSYDKLINERELEIRKLKLKSNHWKEQTDDN